MGLMSKNDNGKRVVPAWLALVGTVAGALGGALGLLTWLGATPAAISARERRLTQVEDVTNGLPQREEFTALATQMAVLSAQLTEMTKRLDRMED